MKKRIVIKLVTVIAILSCIVIVGIVIGFIKVPFLVDENNSDETDMDRISRVMKTTRPTDIFILGEEILFEVDVNINQISKISKEEISTDKSYKVIIINDLNDSITLSTEEIEAARELINKNGYFLIYLGEKYSTTWDKTDEGIANLNGNLCFAYCSWDGQARRNIGSWLKSDQEEIEEYPYSLGQALLYCIEEFLMSGEV